jgi:hypothetical protein
MAEAPLKTELILRGRVASRPVTFVGALQDGKLAEISGSVTLDASLPAILRELGADYGGAAEVLEKLAGGGQDADIVLEKLGAAYRAAGSGHLQIGLIMKLGAATAQFAVLKKLGKQGGFIAGVDLCSGKLALSNNFLSGLIGEIAIGNLGVYYSSERFNDVAFFGAEAFREAAQLTAATLQLPTRNFPKGVKVSAEIFVGGVNLLDTLALQKAEAEAIKEPVTSNGTDETASPANALANGSVFWIETDKAIGPLTIRRVGLTYDPPRIGIKLDAGLKLSVLTLSLEGLGLSYPLNRFSTKPKEIWENLKFQLDGAAVAFAQGPLTIGGGLLKVEVPDHPERLQLDGFLMIQTEIFTISALGSYADLNGTPSLFVFAALQKELGGPAFFFITGLAVGFGINRALKLPGINDVQNFPLIRAATDANYLGQDLDLRKVSQKLGDYIFPMQGNFWIAAGVKFTSFGQLESFALLSVSFGTQLEIALLGISRIRVPKLLPGTSENDVPAIAFAELAFKVAFSPASGVLSFEARLTENSFLLRKDFKLRGGFAFYSWFAGEHEGDFVVSIGGYHPKFKPPAHYPKPDLVEFGGKIGDLVTIRGNCYFALCPSAIMAGGSLSVVYELGGVRAWFIAHADFLIQWKPLYYDIAIGVSIGVALRITVGLLRINLSVELSAALQLHGPPLGGNATVSLYIFSVEIAFGEAKRTPPPLLWESNDPDKSFAKTFLPNPKVTTLTISAGLLGEFKSGDQATSFVAPQKLALSARSLVPATAIRFNADAPKDNDKRPLTIPQPKINGRDTALGVRSMDKSTMYSLLDVSLAPSGDASADAIHYLDQYIAVSLTTKSVPRALWGKPVTDADRNQPPAAAEQMIDDALVGLEIKTKAGPRPWETPALDLEVLAYDRFQVPFDWSAPKPRDALPGFGDKTISNTICAADVVGSRNGILTELTASGRNIFHPDEIHLDQLAASAEYIFQDMPAMARAGQYPPRGYLQT